MIELVYCAAGNRRMAQIAIDAGFLYGSQLPPHGLYFDLFFADQDWKNPNRDRYITALAQYRPQIATVLDWEKAEQLPEVLAWAEEAAVHISEIIIIPKVFGGIAKLPRVISGKSVRLGYSVPTRYGGTEVPAWEFVGWPVHLLGGSPNKQMELARYLNIISTDGNYAQMMAVRYNEFWLNGKWRELEDHGGRVKQDAPYEAFRRSCENIMQAWNHSGR